MAALARELIETRCHRGADIARKMRFSEGVALGIQNLDEHWNGGGMPLNLRGDAIPVYSRIALMAQVIDVFHFSNDAASARTEVKNRAGSWFDPQTGRQPSSASPTIRISGRCCARPISNRRSIRSSRRGR